MFLLRATATSVTDICFEVGFGSLGTFSRTFSEIVGESPTTLVSAAIHPVDGRTGISSARPSSATRLPMWP